MNLSILYRFHRHVTVFLVGVLISESFQNDYRLQSDNRKELYGHCSIANITTLNVGQCLQRCLQNCLCKSFQLCGEKSEIIECQLCSSNKYLHPAAMRHNENCSTFNFEQREEVGSMDFCKGYFN